MVSVVLTLLEFGFGSCPARILRWVLERACLCFYKEGNYSGSRMKQLPVRVVLSISCLLGLSILAYIGLISHLTYQDYIVPCCPVRFQAERLQCRLCLITCFLDFFAV